ncbi:MAG: hypothetical protein EHM72_06285 [Calditrichaeota bacterium]|nr:MAG: hypothetical protein EHM72_06285 [Calditrichota bacterium]
MPQISEIRTKLLENLAQFIPACIKIPGIMRISLIGSLCTTKPDPKDIDVLIFIKDDADLTPLAALTRKLNGRVQSYNHNADVFLADCQGQYLGRVCLYKNCGPGFRCSCDALHCGARKYLHDDLKTIILTRELVSSPPLELWPTILARFSIPIDVDIIIIRPLREIIRKPD